MATTSRGKPAVHGAGTALTNDATNNMDVFSLTAAYALGPGITVDGVVEFVNSADRCRWGMATNDYDGISFGLGTLISF